MILEHNAKRLLIFFFYDKKGIVDDYIPYMLSDMTKSVADTFVVCNGLLSDEGKKKLDLMSGRIKKRWNRSAGRSWMPMMRSC